MSGMQLTAFCSEQEIDAVNVVLWRSQDERLIIEYYTHDCIMSRKTRTEWVEPDRRPLPAR